MAITSSTLSGGIVKCPTCEECFANAALFERHLSADGCIDPKELGMVIKHRWSGTFYGTKPIKRRKETGQ